MVYLPPPQPPIDMGEFSKKIGATANRPPGDFFLLDDNIPFHAARLTLLIFAAGRPRRNPRIEGRTKFAKLDFFVRYPLFLAKAVRIAGTSEMVDATNKLLEKDRTIESKMIRYKYGPWDSKYYLVLAYMVGKQIIEVKTSDGVDSYALTEKGKTLSQSILEQTEWTNIATRCEIVGKLFEERSGTYVKDFIYRHFPEVVHTPHTKLIVNKSTEFENGN